MAKHLSCAVVAFLLLVAVHLISPTAASSPAPREFDYFALALEWPGTICSTTRHCCRSNGCCRSGPPSWFTIHGLWPDYNDGTWPSCCSNSNFDIKKILPLLPEIQEYWPSLYCSSSSTCSHGKGLFWAHEWEKHGTCCTSVLSDEYTYFAKVLSLYKEYNVTKILENAGIHASDSERYETSEIASAIEKGFGAKPKLSCKRGSLQELQLCFDKNFKPRNCLGVSSDTSNVSLEMYDSYTSSSHCSRYIKLPKCKSVEFIDGIVNNITTEADLEMFSFLAIT